MKLRRRAVCALMAVLLALLPAGCREKGVQVVDGAGETVNLRFLGFKVGADKVEEIDGIIRHLSEYRNSIAARDAQTLKALLRDGRIRKEKIDFETGSGNA